MVKERTGSSTGDRKSPERVTVRPPGPVLETLEERLEAGLVLLQMPGDPTASGHGPGALCGCLGTLCHCDGLDCVGICERHCVLDYA